jgi:hypothetical protein
MKVFHTTASRKKDKIRLMEPDKTRQDKTRQDKGKGQRQGQDNGNNKSTKIEQDPKTTAKSPR